MKDSLAKLEVLIEHESDSLDFNYISKTKGKPISTLGRWSLITGEGAKELKTENCINMCKMLKFERDLQNKWEGLQGSF